MIDKLNFVLRDVIRVLYESAKVLPLNCFKFTLFKTNLKLSKSDEIHNFISFFRTTAVFRLWNSVRLWNLEFSKTLEFRMRLWNSEWGFGIQNETLELRMRFWNSEWDFGIQSEALEFGVSLKIRSAFVGHRKLANYFPLPHPLSRVTRQ